MENERGDTPPTQLRTSASPKFLKDAVVGLAILVVLILFWRLMTRPEEWGDYGSWMQTNVFGPFGVRTAQTLRQGLGRSQQPFLETPTHSTTTTNQLLPVGTNSQFVVVTQPFPGGDSPGSGESLLSNSPIKVIAGLPADVSEAPRSPSGTAPLSSSPDSDTMARRLDEVSAKGGDVQISLFWRNYNDLDLHCIDPQGVEIYFSNKRSAQTGGELDVDQNASTPYNAVPVENIYWPAGGAPSGIYKVYVTYYAKHDVIDPTGYTVRTVVKDKTNFFSNTIIFAGQRKTHWICTIQFDPANPNPGLRCRFLSR